MADYKLPISLFIGIMPNKILSKHVDLKLKANRVIFSSKAQLHVLERHRKDYKLLLSSVTILLNNPIYVGFNAKHKNKIELIGFDKYKNYHAVLAISLDADRFNNYQLVTVYRVNDDWIRRKLNNKKALSKQSLFNRR